MGDLAILSSKIDDSTILCVYNEGNVIEDTIDKVYSIMGRTERKHEIVAIDHKNLNAAMHKAIEYIIRKGKDHFKIIGYQKKISKRNARKTRTADEQSDLIVAIDGDMSSISSYVEDLKTNDITAASKWHSKSRNEFIPEQKTMSFSSEVILGLFAGTKSRNTKAGLKALRRRGLNTWSCKSGKPKDTHSS